MARVTVVDPALLTALAAERLTALIEASIATRGSAIVSLTGGNTPRATYEALADPGKPWRTRIDWARVHLFWGDERHVPPDHRESNFGMAYHALVGHVPIPPAQVHRIHGEIPDAREGARAYLDELLAGFRAAGRDDALFDVMLLGLGDDCHIASIFPGSPLLERRDGPSGPLDARRGGPSGPLDDRRGGPSGPLDDRRGGPSGPPPSEARSYGQDSGTDLYGPPVTAVFANHLQSWRITLTPAAILQSRAIVMLVSGETKAAAVSAALEGPLDIPHYPGQLLRQAEDRTEWLLDRPAAARLHDARNA